MKALLVMSLAAATALLASCDQYVEKAKYDASQAKIFELQKQLDEANRTLTESQSHKYQMFSSGFRTFRLNTVTGETCLQLTTKADWKIKDTLSGSCDCRDFLKDALEKEAAVKDPDSFGVTRKFYCGF